MDCVTCMLMGMCMLCGPGFGTSESGRPLTKAEVSQALENMLENMDIDLHKAKPTPPPIIPYNRRQSFSPDFKYSSMGIGKRRGNRPDPYSYGLGIGKRYPNANLNSEEKPSDDTVFLADESAASEPTTAPESSEQATHFPQDTMYDSLLSWATANSIQNFNTNLFKYIFNHMLEREKVIQKSQKLLENERRKLALRRERYGVDPVMTMIGIGR